MLLDNKAVLITGGTGFIGSFIANKLINRNIQVNIISLPNEPKWRIEHLDKCKIFEVDLRDFSKIKTCVKKIKPNIIFHLAAYVNPERDYNLINKAYSINLNGTRNLILALNELKYDLIINTGTSDEYGNNEAPFMENFREKPISPYSASKIAVTHFCEMMVKVYDKPIITVRPFLPYGPKQLTNSLISSLIYYGIEKKELLLTPCEQTRDFIFIEDLADAFICLAENFNKVKDKGIFNVGSGKEVRIKEIVDLIREKIKNTKFIIGGRPYRVGENMHYYSSINKIKKILGWIPKWSIKEGLNKTIEWWQNNRNIWMKYKNIWESN